MIRLENLSLRAGDFALEGIDLSVPTGGYAVLMGKTGCGKSTILEAVCGLKPVAAGRVFLMDRDVTQLKPAERGIGYVPQDGALFSTLTVRDHLAFALQIRGCGRAEIAERIGPLAEMLGIQHLLLRKPRGLSGGEAQRVSLGRALAFEPEVLCLDEPLSALDHDTRIEMCDLLLSVRRRVNVTVLHVTHDRNEAARLADCLFELEDGQLRPAEAGW